MIHTLSLSLVFASSQRLLSRPIRHHHQHHPMSDECFCLIINVNVFISHRTLNSDRNSITKPHKNITSKMKVFMLGGNDSSAVGTFTEVTMGDLLPEQLRVKHIACGRHFVVVTEDDQVYVYGDNSSQQLSLSTIKPTKNKFAKIEGPWGSRRITHLRCSNYATAIATHSHLYMVGDNRNGQCK